MTDDLGPTADADRSPPDNTDGDTALRRSAAELVPLLHAQLRRQAQRARRLGPAGETLQTTALLHEAFLRLDRSGPWQDAQHFLGAAAMAMRQILVDDWRRRQAQRRGGGAAEVPLDDGIEIAAPVPGADVLAVDEALRALEAESPRLARLVECRFFAGYSEAETAQALGVSPATVQRDWAKARAWLHRALS